MSSMPTLTDHAHEHRVSRAEFDALRDAATDSNRYELLDGEVLVTPSPTGIHQLVVSRLLMRLGSVAPTGVEVVTAPLDVLLHTVTGDTTLQPDVLMTSREQLTEGTLTSPPLLVVEVLSPTTWHRDLGAKLAAYAAAGVPHYWVIAPQTPSLTTYRHGADGRYAETLHIAGEASVSILEPVQLELSPAELVR